MKKISDLDHDLDSPKQSEGFEALARVQTNHQEKEATRDKNSIIRRIFNKDSTVELTSHGNLSITQPSHYTKHAPESTAIDSTLSLPPLNHLTDKELLMVYMTPVSETNQSNNSKSVVRNSARENSVAESSIQKQDKEIIKKDQSGRLNRSVLERKRNYSVLDQSSNNQEISCGQFGARSDILGDKSPDFFLTKKYSQLRAVERVQGMGVGRLSKSNTGLGEFDAERRRLMKKDAYEDYMGISTRIHKEIHKKLFQKKKKSHRDGVQTRQA